MRVRIPGPGRMSKTAFVGKNARFRAIFSLPALALMFLPSIAAFCVESALVVDAAFPDGTFLFYSRVEDGGGVGDRFEVLRDGFIIGEAEVYKVKPPAYYARMTGFTLPVRDGDELRRFEAAAEEAEAPPVAVPGEEPAAPAETEPGVKPPVEAAPAPAAGEERPPVTIEEKTKKRLLVGDVEVTLDGYHYLKYRTYGSTGNEDSFLNENALKTYGATLEQGTQLTLSAEYKKKFILSGEVFQLPLQDRRLLFKFDTTASEEKKMSGQMGSFTTGFRTGALSPFDKQVSGGEVLYSTEKYDAGWIFSESDSETKTETFPGNGSYGPYKLKSVEILPDSVIVEINGQPVPPGEYKLDFYLGKITFCDAEVPPNCRKLTESDRVQVTYEERSILALKGPGIHGFGGAYRPGGVLKEAGVSYLVKEAFQSDQRLKEQRTFTVTGEQLHDPLQFATSTRIVLPQPAGAGGFLLLDPGFEEVSRSGTPLMGCGVSTGDDCAAAGGDFYFEYDGYARGIINLVEEPLNSPGVVFVVGYVYYSPSLKQSARASATPADVVSASNRIYLGTGASPGRIFSGTETVAACRDSKCTLGTPDCETIDEAHGYGADPYRVSEFENSIIFNFNVSSIVTFGYEYVCVEYTSVPGAAPSGSRYDHTVTDFFSTWKFGENVTAAFEYASSNSDISRTPIQIFRERVAVFDAAVTCPSGAVPDPCRRELKYDDVVENSERIYLSSTDEPLAPGTSYSLELDTGVLTFAAGAAFATDVIVYADYQYHPPAVETGVVTGSAYTFQADGGFGGVSFGLTKNAADTYYAPLTANTTLETDRTEATIAWNSPSGLDLKYAQSRFSRASDVDRIFYTDTDSSSYEIGYGTGRLKSLRFSSAKEDSSDNRDPHVTNYERSTTAYAADVELIPDKLTANYGVTDADYDDLTRQTTSSSGSDVQYGFAYAPGPNLTVSANFSRSTVDYSGPSEYSTTNRSRGISASWSALKPFTVDVEINSQGRSDTRPDSTASSYDSSFVRIESQEFGNFTGVSLSITRDDFPGQTSGSRSKNLVGAFTYKVSNAFRVKPSYSKNLTQVIGSNSTLSTTRATAFEYTPAGRPYGATLQLARTRDSGSTSGDASTKRLNAEFKYEFSEKMDSSLKYDRSASSGPQRSDLNRTLWYNLNYHPSEDWTVTTKLEMNSSGTASSSTRRRNLYLNSNMTLSSLLTWSLDIRLTRLSSSTQPDYGNRGRVIETELRANF
ncbi:MAG: hypothetical protein AB1742_01365 [bacterium]